MSMKRIKTETLQMREYFEYYYALGDKRSYEKVANEFKVSVTSIRRYSYSFNWMQRIEQRDLDNAQEIEKRTNDIIVNSKARYREIIHSLTDDFVKAVDDGKIKIRNILDFERIVRLDMELMGVNSEEEEADNVASLVEALKSSGMNNVPDPDTNKEPNKEELH